MVEQGSQIPNFIPREGDSKKARSHIERIRRYLNAMLALGIIVFGIGVAGSILAYLLLNSAQKELVNKKDQLIIETASADEQKIAELNRFDTRLKVAKQLLANHRIITPILEELGDYTLQVVQLQNASIDVTNLNEITISGMGEAYNYQSLATQSDAFSESQYFSDPIFSSFQLNEDDYVSFQYSLRVDPRLTESVFAEVQSQASNPEQPELIINQPAS